MAIRDYLMSRRVHFVRLLHQPAASATRRAQCLHVPGRHVAKAVLVRSGQDYVLAVLPATHRIDLDRLGQCLHAADLRIAGEEEIERVFVDCERGAIPPFGRAYGLKTIVDASLAGASEIIIEGNLRHEGMRLRYRDYEEIEHPIRARFAFTNGSARPLPPRAN